MLQSVVGDGDEFRLVVGGAARLGVPLHLSWPEHVVFAMTHPVDISFQFLVGVDGHIVGKVLIVFYGREHVFVAVLCVLGLMDEALQHFFLESCPMIDMFLQFLCAGMEYLSYNSS